MKKMRWYRWDLKVLVVACFVCLALVGCDDDDNSNSGLPVAQNNPNYGYVKNSTEYTIAIDFGKDNDFSTKLAPGQMLGFNMDEGRAHLLHTVVLDNANRAISEFYTNFYVDETALDNEWNGFVCSWYVDILRESGFGSDMGD